MTGSKPLPKSRGKRLLVIITILPSTSLHNPLLKGTEVRRLDTKHDEKSMHAIVREGRGR